MGVFDDGYGEALYVPTEVPAAYAPPPSADAKVAGREAHLGSDLTRFLDGENAFSPLSQPSNEFCSRGGVDGTPVSSSVSGSTHCIAPVTWFDGEVYLVPPRAGAGQLRGKIRTSTLNGELIGDP